MRVWCTVRRKNGRAAKHEENAYVQPGAETKTLYEATNRTRVCTRKIKKTKKTNSNNNNNNNDDDNGTRAFRIQSRRVRVRARNETRAAAFQM